MRLGRSLSAPPLFASEEKEDGLLPLGSASRLLHENGANAANSGDLDESVAGHAQDDAGDAQDSTPHRDAQEGTALLAHPSGSILPQVPSSRRQMARPLKTAQLQELWHGTAPGPSTAVSPNQCEIYSDDGEMDQEEEERQAALEQEEQEEQERQDGMGQMRQASAERLEQMAQAGYPKHPEHAAHPQHPEHQEARQLQPPREVQEALEEQDSAFVPEIEEDTDDEEQDAWLSCARLGETRSKGAPKLACLASPVNYLLLRYMVNCSVFVGRAPQGPAWTSGTSAAATWMRKTMAKTGCPRVTLCHRTRVSPRVSPRVSQRHTDALPQTWVVGRRRGVSQS